MRFAHLSDLHLETPGGASQEHGLTALEVADAVAADLASIAQVLDLVVVSGDLTENADPEAFATFERMFSDIGLPVIVVPGNHDGPENMHAYCASSSVLAGWDITNRVVEIAATRFLGLDTCIANTTEGSLDGVGLALLDDEITRNAEGNLVVVMHHPPLVLGQGQFDSFSRLEGHEKLMEILGKAQKRIIILSGHVHRPYTAVEGMASCHVAGSMIAPYDSALPFGDLPIRPTTLQDFYFIHELDSEGRHLVTPQRVRGLAR